MISTTLTDHSSNTYKVLRICYSERERAWNIVRENHEREREREREGEERERVRRESVGVNKSISTRKVTLPEVGEGGRTQSRDNVDRCRG